MAGLVKRGIRVDQ